MDLNLAVIAGRLSAEPDIRVFDTKEPDDPQLSNINVVRLLVTTRTEAPKRRIDVIPVSWWCSDDELAALELRKGDRVWIAGAVQRRFWRDDEAKSSIEVTAYDVQKNVPERGVANVVTMAPADTIEEL